MSTEAVRMAKSFDASDLLNEACCLHGIQLELLVAETGLWAHPQVHLQLMKGGSAARYPSSRRYRPGQGEKRGQRLDALILDDNTRANIAIKNAIGIHRNDLRGFETCHIWPKSCYDERCHTAIANLVLLPRALASLTDHCLEIQQALQYRAFELYAWHPQDVNEPVKPARYPSNWREPMPSSGRSSDNLLENIDPSVPLQPHRDLKSYELITRSQSYSSLSKRVTMLRLATALMHDGISPRQIEAVAAGLPIRMFASVEGHPDSKGFLAQISRDWRQQGRNFDPIRYFCQSDALIHFGSRTYAVSNQWGPWTDGAIMALLQAFPECGISVTAMERSRYR